MVSSQGARGKDYRRRNAAQPFLAILARGKYTTLRALPKPRERRVAVISDQHNAPRAPPTTIYFLGLHPRMDQECLKKALIEWGLGRDVTQATWLQAGSKYAIAVPTNESIVQGLDGRSLQFKDGQSAVFTHATSATTGFSRCHMNGQVFREGKESVLSELPVT